MHIAKRFGVIFAGNWISEIPNKREDYRTERCYYISPLSPPDGWVSGWRETGWIWVLRTYIGVPCYVLSALLV